MIPDAVILAEQAVLSRALVSRDAMARVSAGLEPADFAEPIHAKLLETIRDMSGDGRPVSVTALVAALPDVEISDDLRLHGYLRRMVSDSLDLMAVPLDDAIETVRDAARRRAIDTIGAQLSGISRNGHASVREIARAAMDQLDDVLASLRASKRTLMTSGGASEAALAFLGSEARPFPTTGLVDLDRTLGGWPRGQLSILAGRPGMGKSAVGLSTALRAAKAGHRVAMFSLEMQQVQIGARMLCDAAYVGGAPIHYEDVLSRRLDGRAQHRLEAAREFLSGVPFEIDEQRGLTVSEIAARARRMADAAAETEHPLEVVMVDHIGLIRPSSRYAGNRVREIAEITDGLATLAKDLDVAVVGLCQLNRGVEGRENKRPSLADLRDSGAIEEDASAVIFCFRPAYYLETMRCDDAEDEARRQESLERQRHKLELIVAKNRNGRIGTVDAFVDIGANAIRNAAYGGR